MNQLYKNNFLRYIQYRQTSNLIGRGLPVGFTTAMGSPIMGAMTGDGIFALPFIAGFGYISSWFYYEIRADEQYKVCQKILSACNQQEELKRWSVLTEFDDTNK
jgi:hypothetical protein